MKKDYLYKKKCSPTDTFIRNTNKITHYLKYNSIPLLVIKKSTSFLFEKVCLLSLFIIKLDIFEIFIKV